MKLKTAMTHILKFSLLVLLTSFISITTYSQSIDEDNTVLYMKANVLYESGRYDEAVRMYNRILSKDDSFTNAYIMRAKTKYQLGAFKGTKKDILVFIDKAGVNKEVIKLMANTEYRLNNLKAASNYNKTAIELDPYDGELYHQAGMIAMDDGRKNDACESYAIGSTLGHGKSSEKFSGDCNGYVIKSKNTKQQPSPIDENIESTGEVASIDSTRIPMGNQPSKNIPEVEVVNESPIDYDALQEVKIDEKLNIAIGNGLGDRNVEDKPNIFILSTEDGVVAINICVDSDGKVINAEYDRAASTLYRSSLTSLALRKSREFIFMPSLKGEQCGTMLYKIKA